MRRRRRQDKTLMKAMGIALLITALLLPIMAYLGLFKVIKQKYYAVALVNLPPPKPLPKAAQPHHKKTASKSHSASHETEHRAVARAKPLPFHVAASASSGNSSGPSIVNGTNTNIGKAPAAPAAAASAPSAPVASAPATSASAPASVAQGPPSPAITQAEVVSDPRPSIPDDLLGSDVNTDFWALFTIHADGTADVTMLKSTGNQELDSLAMQCAREWRFKPATEDGKPVESYERLDVEFQVS